MENLHIKITVIGKVQGVYFRAHTEKMARYLSLHGFCRNQPDGSVYIEAEGPQHALNDLVQWCHEGSPRSEVKEVRTEFGEVEGLGEFEVRY